MITRKVQNTPEVENENLMRIFKHHLQSLVLSLTFEHMAKKKARMHSEEHY
jgi:hypothetical protein